MDIQSGMEYMIRRKMTSIETIFLKHISIDKRSIISQGKFYSHIK